MVNVQLLSPALIVCSNEQSGLSSMLALSTLHCWDSKRLEVGLGQSVVR